MEEARACGEAAADSRAEAGAPEDKPGAPGSAGGKEEPQNTGWGPLTGTLRQMKALPMAKAGTWAAKQTAQCQITSSYGSVQAPQP